MDEPLDALESRSEPRAIAESRRWPWVLVALALVFGTAVLGLDRRANGDAPVRAIPRGDVPATHDGRIEYSETFAARAGLLIDVVGVREVVPVVEVTGTVAFDPRRVAAVGSRIVGRVTDVAVVAGDRVRRGDVLARLESAELGGAQADAMSLAARTEAAELDAERKRLLVDEGIASRRSAQQSEAEHASLSAQLEAARQRVTALGGRSTKGKLGRFSLRAPIDGEVVAVHVQRGQSVEPSHTAFHVADLAVVWVELALFERDLGRVAVGDAVDLVPRGDQGPPVPGYVSHIGRVLDTATRTASVRVVVDNIQHRLYVGQAVRARVHAAKLAVDGPAVPRGAVVLVDARPTVFVEVGRQVVEPREVEIAAEGREFIAIANGVAPGDRVVVDGAFALKSELFR